jgi:hypothetical protein
MPKETSDQASPKSAIALTAAKDRDGYFHVFYLPALLVSNLVNTIESFLDGWRAHTYTPLLTPAQRILSPNALSVNKDFIMSPSSLSA